MPVCSKCTSDISDKEAVVCSTCSGWFHPACTRHSAEYFRKLGSKKGAWKCDTCKSEASSLGDSTENMDKNTLQILQHISNLRTEMHAQFDTKFTDLGEKLVNVCDSIDILKCAVTSLSSENELRKTEYAALINKNEHLEAEVKLLKTHVEDLQQHTRKNNLEIVGVPLLGNRENIYEVLQGIARAIKIPYSSNEVSIAHRLPVSNRSQHPTIIVNFIARETKIAWIRAARSKKKLYASEIHENLPATPVYLNDHLTLQMKSVLGRARHLVRERKLEFVWTVDCKVLVKVSADSRFQRVRSLEDLDAIVRAPAVTKDS